MTKRGEKARQTGARILAAARELFSTLEFDQVTLAEVARGASVTEQTVIRHFGGKAGLFATLCEQEGARISRLRNPPEAANSPKDAVAALVEHYEQDGAMVLHFLKQESRSVELAEVLQHGRDAHEDWVKQHFGAQLKGARGKARSRLLAALVAATDLYVWKLLRIDRAMARAEVEKVMLTLVRGAATKG